MNSEQYELFISLLIGEITRLQKQVKKEPIRTGNYVTASPTFFPSAIDYTYIPETTRIKPTSNNTWKKLKRDKKTGRFRKRVRK